MFTNNFACDFYCEKFFFFQLPSRTLNMEIEPSPTIYINNLNEKIKKDVLKKLLYMLFSQYGKVRQIVACKGVKLRGQVKLLISELIFIVFIYLLDLLFERHGLCSMIRMLLLLHFAESKDLNYTAKKW
jgi:RNA recognition motif-containing protein